MARGWLGCFAARNTLHYTVGVVYKRLFFFSLACLQPPPRHSFLLSCLPFFLFPHLFLLEATTSTCQQVSSEGRELGVTSRKAQSDSSSFLLLLPLPGFSHLSPPPSSSFSHTLPSSSTTPSSPSSVSSALFFLFEKLRKISSMTRSLRYPTHLVARGKGGERGR